MKTLIDYINSYISKNDLIKNTDKFFGYIPTKNNETNMFSKYIRRLNQLNFSKTLQLNKKPKKIPQNKWVQEFSRGCILCALINSGYINQEDLPEYVQKYQGKLLDDSQSFESTKHKIEITLGLSELWIKLGGIDPAVTSKRGVIDTTQDIIKEYKKQLKLCTESNYFNYLKPIYVRMRNFGMFASSRGIKMNLKRIPLKFNSRDELVNFLKSKKIVVVSFDIDRVQETFSGRLKRGLEDFKNDDESFFKKLEFLIDYLLHPNDYVRSDSEIHGKHFVSIYNAETIIDSMPLNDEGLAVPFESWCPKIIDDKQTISDFETPIGYINEAYAKDMYKIFDSYIEVI